MKHKEIQWNAREVSVCGGVGNLCDQCLRKQEKPQYNSGYNIGHNRRK